MKIKVGEYKKFLSSRLIFLTEFISSFSNEVFNNSSLIIILIIF